LTTKKEWIKKHGEAGPFPHFLEPDVPEEAKPAKTSIFPPEEKKAPRVKK